MKIPPEVLSGEVYATVEQVAWRFGCSTKSVRRKCYTRLIHHSKVGRRLLFLLPQIEAHFAVKPQPQQ